MSTTAQPPALSDVKKFLLAGNATLTVTSKATGKRFTFRVKRAARPTSPHFVSVLTGPDNEQDYEFLGTIFQGQDYKPSVRSRIAPTAPAAMAARWVCRQVLRDRPLDAVEIHHEGHCGRCGRKLTVPESIESGFGPECINHL